MNSSPMTMWNTPRRTGVLVEARIDGVCHVPTVRLASDSGPVAVTGSVSVRAYLRISVEKRPGIG